MWVQHALQDGAGARQADALELGAQEIDGEAVERVERVSARATAHSLTSAFCVASSAAR